MPLAWQLHRIVEGLSPGDVLRISDQFFIASYTNRNTKLNPPYPHRVWRDDRTLETCIERLS